MLLLQTASNSWITLSKFKLNIEGSNATGRGRDRFHKVNPLIATLKPQSNGPSYSNTVIGTLVVDGWAVTFGTGNWAGPQPAQTPPHCTKCNSPPINGQCTNFVLFDVAL